MSCGIGGKCGLDPTLLWLWQRPVAIALIRPLAWQPLYAVGAALERQKKKKFFLKKQTKILKQVFFFFFRTSPAAFGNSQARGLIRATAASLYHSHSNMGSKLHLRPTTQFTATPDP